MNHDGHFLDSLTFRSGSYIYADDVPVANSSAAAAARVASARAGLILESMVR